MSGMRCQENSKASYSDAEYFGKGVIKNWRLSKWIWVNHPQCWGRGVSVELGIRNLAKVVLLQNLRVTMKDKAEMLDTHTNVFEQRSLSSKTWFQ